MKKSARGEQVIERQAEKGEAAWTEESRVRKVADAAEPKGAPV